MRTWPSFSSGLDLTAIIFIHSARLCTCNPQKITGGSSAVAEIIRKSVWAIRPHHRPTPASIRAGCQYIWRTRSSPRRNLLLNPAVHRNMNDVWGKQTTRILCNRRVIGLLPLYYQRDCSAFLGALCLPSCGVASVFPDAAEPLAKRRGVLVGRTSSTHSVRGRSAAP